MIIARTGEQAVDAALGQEVDVLLLNLRLPDIHGADVMSQGSVKDPAFAIAERP